MITSKVHLIKELLNHTLGISRILILGPLSIKPELLKKSLKTHSPQLIIMVDGGLHHKKNLSKTAQKRAISVGDGDSVRNFLKLDIILPTKKDYSDLSFVLSCLLKSNKQTPITGLTLLGFSSEDRENRFDHLLFNLGAVENMANKLNLSISMDEQYLFFPKGKNTFHHKGLFSLITFSSAQVKIQGACEYQLENWTKLSPLSSVGLSNIGKGQIHLESSKAILVYKAGTKLSS